VTQLNTAQAASDLGHGELLLGDHGHGRDWCGRV